MGALFQIVAYSIGNLFLGILLTVVGVILLFVLIQSWYRNSTFTPVSYIVGGILFLFRKHSDKCTFYTLRFDCSFAAANTIKPQLL